MQTSDLTLDRGKSNKAIVKCLVGEMEQFPSVERLVFVAAVHCGLEQTRIKM